MELDVLIMPHIAKIELKSSLCRMIYIQWDQLFLIKKIWVWVKLIL